MSTATKTQNSGFEDIVSSRIGRHFLFQIFITDKHTLGLLSSAKKLSEMLTFSKTRQILFSQTGQFKIALLTEASKSWMACKSDQDLSSTQRWHQKLICQLCSRRIYHDMSVGGSRTCWFIGTSTSPLERILLFRHLLAELTIPNTWIK